MKKCCEKCRGEKLHLEKGSPTTCPCHIYSCYEGFPAVSPHMHSADSKIRPATPTRKECSCFDGTNITPNKFCPVHGAATPTGEKECDGCDKCVKTHSNGDTNDCPKPNCSCHSFPVPKSPTPQGSVRERFEKYYAHCVGVTGNLKMKAIWDFIELEIVRAKQEDNYESKGGYCAVCTGILDGGACSESAKHEKSLKAFIEEEVERAQIEALSGTITNFNSIVIKETYQVPLELQDHFKKLGRTATIKEIKKKVEALEDIWKQHKNRGVIRSEGWSSQRPYYIDKEIWEAVLYVLGEISKDLAASLEE